MNVAWHFEPKVAESVFNDNIHKAQIDVLFDYSVVGLKKKSSRIQTIQLKDYDHCKKNLTIWAKVFIDVSYEGDLIKRCPGKLDSLKD